MAKLKGFFGNDASDEQEKPPPRTEKPRRVDCGRCGRWYDEAEDKLGVSMCPDCWEATLHMHRNT